MNVLLLEKMGYAVFLLTVAGVYTSLSLLRLKKISANCRSETLFNLFLSLLFLSLALLFFFYAFEWQGWTSSSFFPLLVGGLGLLPALLVIGAKKLFRPPVADPAQISARQFDQLKEQFLSMASHELRTPLSIINGFTEVLMRERVGPLNDEQKRRLRKVLLQGERLNRIVDELLDLSRIRSGKIEVRKEIFDIVPPLKACLEDHQVVCEQKHIELEDQIPGILPDVVGDLERVTQVVVNLLNNAVKYTEPGGKISARAFYEKDKEKVRVEIKDTGIGIDPADQLHIFEEFFRADHRSERKYSGSGLGLAIVKQLVQAQGGQAGLFSEGAGKGSTFFFTLPISKNSKT